MIADAPMCERWSWQTSSFQIPASMQFDGCISLSRRSTTSKPSGCQLIWQHTRTPLFKHDLLKSAHQFHTDFPISLHDDSGHLLQNDGQELGTGGG